MQAVRRFRNPACQIKSPGYRWQSDGFAGSVAGWRRLRLRSLATAMHALPPDGKTTKLSEYIQDAIRSTNAVILVRQKVLSALPAYGCCYARPFASAAQAACLSLHTAPIPGQTPANLLHQAAVAPAVDLARPQRPVRGKSQRW